MILDIVYFICGIVFSIVLYWLFKNWRKKTEGEKSRGRKIYTCKFDERQLLARGKAYQYSFFTMLFVMWINGYFMEVYEWCTLWTFMYTNMVISVLVFVAICIFNDAYFQLSAKPHFFIFLSLFLGIINLLSTVFEYRDNGTLFDQDGKFDNTNLECAILMFGISIIFIIKKLISKDEDGDAYEES